MNYYNPYYSFIPYTGAAASAPVRQGILSGLLGRGGGINWSSILNNTQRVLGIANQAIPVVKQITPVMKNARTMFQVMNEFKKVDSPVSPTQTSTEPTFQTSMTSNHRNDTINIPNPGETIQNSTSGPTFFI